MRFIDFARYCERLEAISGRLETIDVVSEMLSSLTEEELPIVVRFVTGKIFPDWSPLKLGIGPNLLYEAVAYVVGKKKNTVVEEINRTGDAGEAIEHLIATKEQTSFFKAELETSEVYREFEKLAEIEGKGSQREKLLAIRKLFGNASPLEARYLARITLEELRIGVGEGNVRDAIAKAFQVDNAMVEHAYQAINDLGEVARLARKGESALAAVNIQLFRPVKMMLAQQGSIADMIKDYGHVAAEFKFDGSRFQFHKQGSSSRIYSRKLEDVTNALPDVVRQLTPAVDGDVILDGEVIAVKDGKPRPFQFVLRRFRRKHAVAAHMEEIELVPHVFDILYHNGKTLIDEPLRIRREFLEKALTAFIAPQVQSNEIPLLEEFYHRALEEGHEGIMVKDPGSRYTPGVRGKSWVKIKPEVDTLDLAVIGAEWGEGRRAHYFGSFLLACQDRGKLLPIGKVATGISDENLALLYDLFKDLVISQSGKEVSFEPQVVFEVGYSEIQESPNYESGYALRFPRFVRIRDDKSVDEVESLDMIRHRHQNKGKDPGETTS
ncbi:MAG: ATP-dependent DNA ligase [Methanomicrobiales archaeon]|nr:ATP-dependent DNA ligase [Methanomicrobiales archaeon]